MQNEEKSTEKMDAEHNKKVKGVKPKIWKDGNAQKIKNTGWLLVAYVFRF